MTEELKKRMFTVENFYHQGISVTALNLHEVPFVLGLRGLELSVSYLAFCFSIRVVEYNELNCYTI